MTLAAVEPNYPVEHHFTASVDPTGGRLVAWADGLSAAHRIGTALCETAFVPQHFKGKPAEAAAAILFGDEIGFTPTQSLRSIFVISGTPGLYARAMVALVLSHGHKVWTEGSSDDQVTVCGQRKGSTHVEKVTWTTARARKAGYTKNAKYESDPQSMLYARAAAEVCRKVAPDALAGIAMSVEELELETTPAKAQTVRRAKITAEVVQPPEPDLEPEPADVEPDPITDAQLKKLHTALSKAGMGKPEQRDQALSFYAGVIGREIESSKDLTKDEASRVIDRLEQDETPEPALEDGALL